MNFIIFGPQASGKGTQAIRIAEKFGLIHISTGKIFRANIANQTEIGLKIKAIINKGELVPDSLTNKIVQNRLEEEDCKSGFVLDGFPRNRNQADFLDTLHHKFKSVVDLEVPKTTIINRISTRRVCINCKQNYNTISLKPKVEGICDKCDGELIQRNDDQPEAIENRLKIYEEQTKPLLDFYEKKGILLPIDGDQGIDEVFEEIIKKLES